MKRLFARNCPLTLIGALVVLLGLFRRNQAKDGAKDGLKRILTAELGKHVGERVRLMGWLHCLVLAENSIRPCCVGKG
jgi:hypothetical protein